MSPTRSPSATSRRRGCTSKPCPTSAAAPRFSSALLTASGSQTRWPISAWGPSATAVSFSTKSNSAVSYFASLDADEKTPDVILSGDRHLLTNRFNVDGRLFLATTNTTGAHWTTNQHDGGGNFALSDGSVQQVTSSDLTAQMRMQGIATNRLLLPLLP